MPSGFKTVALPWLHVGSNLAQRPRNILYPVWKLNLLTGRNRGNKKISVIFLVHSIKLRCLILERKEKNIFTKRRHEKLWHREKFQIYL